MTATLTRTLLGLLLLLLAYGYGFLLPGAPAPGVLVREAFKLLTRRTP